MLTEQKAAFQALSLFAGCHATFPSVGYLNYVVKETNTHSFQEVTVNGTQVSPWDKGVRSGGFTLWAQGVQERTGR